MNKLFILPFTLCTYLFPVQSQTPADYVNPFIGTSNYGATYPGSVAPSGMISVVPYNVSMSEGNKLNTDVGWLSNPYVFQNKTLTGFSHVNLSGVGCPDFGSILLMPTSGKLEVDYRKYGTTYSNEKANPGYYSNTLDIPHKNRNDSYHKKQYKPLYLPGGRIKYIAKPWSWTHK